MPLNRERPSELPLDVLNRAPYSHELGRVRFDVARVADTHVGEVASFVVDDCRRVPAALVKVMAEVHYPVLSDDEGVGNRPELRTRLRISHGVELVVRDVLDRLAGWRSGVVNGDAGDALYRTVGGGTLRQGAPQVVDGDLGA